MDVFHERLVRRIRETAHERGIPLTQVPDRAEVSRSHFWSVLAGKTSPTLQWLVKIADALDVDPRELLARAPRPHRGA